MGISMPDEMDHVQELSELERENLIAGRHRPTGVSLAVCIVCGDDIPPARQAASPGCCKCIVCQTEFEFMHGR